MQKDINTRLRLCLRVVFVSEMCAMYHGYEHRHDNYKKIHVITVLFINIDMILA